MMGVHGNGLSSLLWMSATPQTTVIEFFAPGGFAHDYEWTARTLGMQYYGIWGDRCVSPQRFLFTVHGQMLIGNRPGRSFDGEHTPEVAYPEDFHGNAIPLDGKLVARLCEKQLQQGDNMNG
jgi:hypothetical protein